MAATSLESLKETGEAPEWLDEPGYKTLLGGYLLAGETPKDAYRRVARTASQRLKRPNLEQPFFDIIWKNWLCLATPVMANMGTERGLPISCFGLSVGDSLDSILQKNHELGMLSKYGGGVSIYHGDLRSRGTAVNGTGGVSDGVLAWAKIHDSTIHSTNQGSTRRGAAVVYLPTQHNDFSEFLQFRRPVGDLNKRCLNLHQGAAISDQFMHDALDGNKHNQALWSEMLTLRFETGEPYFFFVDNVNKANPPWYKSNGLAVSMSNLCTEIMLHTDPMHTFVCCLSSMNLTKWHEWKDTNTVHLATYFLDAVIEEFIVKASKIPGFESAVRFATKSRAIGIGALGWHTLLQTSNIAFDSLDAMMLNAQIFRHIDQQSLRASQDLAKEYGEPEWCKGYGVRNSHRTAVAPTVSNSTISGGVSAGIEPIAANIFVQKSAKGTFVRKNKQLEKVLQEKGADTDKIWSQISKDNGSVQSLKVLSNEEKEVFLAAREINQFAIIKQAAQRQAYIDQGQSVNLFFGLNSDPKYVHEVHLEAWKTGLKSLYYCRTEALVRADLASRSADECKACEG